MAQPQIYEGTAEEIVDQIRRSNLIGRFKAIIMSDEYNSSAINGTGETLETALAPLLAEAERIECESPVPPTDLQEKAFGQIIEEKYRKMGFKL